jgi:hypothetical protein
VILAGSAVTTSAVAGAVVTWIGLKDESSKSTEEGSKESEVPPALSAVKVATAIIPGPFTPEPDSRVSAVYAILPAVLLPAVLLMVPAKKEVLDVSANSGPSVMRSAASSSGLKN